MLAQWTLQRFDSWSGWAGASINNEERAATLKLLVWLAVLCKSSRNLVVHTPEFAASQLAIVDFAKTAAHPVDNIIQNFEENLALLGRSWLLQIDMPTRLRLSDLGELKLTDLKEVQHCLNFGWMQEFHIPCGMKTPTSNVWMTPARRA